MTQEQKDARQTAKASFADKNVQFIERIFHRDGASAAEREIFVFGSNLSGIHGGGAARAALNLYSAKWGQAEGRQGRSYAIPTVKVEIAGPLSVTDIQVSINAFLAYANAHPNEQFLVTRVGCGLAGYLDEQIAPLFSQAPANCSLPSNWESLVGKLAPQPAAPIGVE